ncbi:hypothetical protein HUA74_37390 [Myxococcus sp. CA051A]|uniref:hypothetical protein n=1 Tax=unclassified Myxococcus TaxID=2648731 RepID=UPI00157AC33D|nr:MULTISPECIES: hypothetical protein [unclassified Myxococcus]NTX12910.1 hypothetical protein [Myxococcus sp. CA056]NTX66348.1 hypothetical protein [Myxococcus sp. CA051A]
MELQLLKCPGCGAKLPPPSSPNGILTCDYCGAMVSAKGAAVWPKPARPADDPPFAPDRPRVTVANTRYVLLGRLGRGDGSDVFLARRDSRITELVVLKVARALDDKDLLAREYEVLEDLQRTDAQGAEYFTRLLPQPVARGTAKDPEGIARAALVYRWTSGFQHTFSEAREVYSDGVDPRAAVWMWKRALELLGFVHRAGYVHGAVLPPHLLLHPRDHGLMLVGWSSAVRHRSFQSLPSTSASHRDFYPDALWNGGVPTPETDVAMCARSITWVLGGDPATGAVPSRVPAPLAELLRAQHSGRSGLDVDAWSVKEQVSAAAQEAFGPPSYVPFTLPGWR